MGFSFTCQFSVTEHSSLEVDYETSMTQLNLVINKQPDCFDHPPVTSQDFPGPLQSLETSDSNSH